MQALDELTRVPVSSEDRARHARFLAAWAQDALRLRRLGLDRPSSRRGTSGAVLATLGPTARKGAAA